LALENDKQIIAIEAVVDPRTKKYVHHFLVAGYITNGTLMDGTMMYGWGPGMAPLVLPPNAGFRVGPSTNLTQLRMQTHFHNPNNETFEDWSGIRVYYTSKLREYDASTLMLGDVFVTDINGIIPQGSGYTHLEYECPSDCTSQWPNDITVFSSFLHMHETGSQFWSSHTSAGNKTITNRIDFWSFGFQQQTNVNYTIKRGDRINTHCVYHRQPDRQVIMGKGSTDEMCLETVAYYPKIPGVACGFYHHRTRGESTMCGSKPTFGKNLINPENETDIKGWFGSQNTSRQCQSNKDLVPSGNGMFSIPIMITLSSTLIIVVIVIVILLRVRKAREETYF